MITTPSAINAYNNQLKLAKNASEALDASQQSNGSSFADMLSSQLEDVVNTQNTAEAAKIDAISGKGDITDLVTAIANAELALNTIVTVRDRAISAYQDIIRMPI